MDGAEAATAGRPGGEAEGATQTGERDREGKGVVGWRRSTRWSADLAWGRMAIRPSLAHNPR